MADSLTIPALKVNQWLPEWDDVNFDDSNDNRRKPEPYFLMFTIKAGLLKKLSKVYHRKADENRDVEIGVQRKHDPERSLEINKYVKVGYPLSDYAKNDKAIQNLGDLKMPGWLPTAIVANILKQGESRGKHSLKDLDVIRLSEVGGFVNLQLPNTVNNPDWNPDVPPIEIIDGQHRLWAFDADDKISDEFEFPVVAFYNLDITWQAYLFYTINVKPKKINRSLAYDLYPLLRIQEWLERAPETAFVYKEIRAQEIVEVLWSYTDSPWKDKINMLGDTAKSIGEGKNVPNITQAAFIRNLIATFIKTTSNKGLGGLFGAKLADDYNSPLNWNRTQQASFIIYVWEEMYTAVSKAQESWAASLRGTTYTAKEEKYTDPAFFSKFSLLSSDQGVRGFLHIMNDMVFKHSVSLEIRNIKWEIDNEQIKEERIDPADVKSIIADFRKSKLAEFIEKVCNELIKFDWRVSSEPGLSAEQRRKQMLFKGSSGYKELRTQLLVQLSNAGDKTINEVADDIINNLGYAS
ncbi:DGQHR domain-containing protein [Mucilaginibacter aquariorum]|uniref:DGQHR domain-containing protein n=1 Tax=Mucilaginibacter aquariorum TaxID=2967225 RepID=A0ABT1T1W8_9SPHI|nr:DGQHR domain-containing protein [Mucilaginibacter aquariorum]MCQ6958600.1 DGQHR domain-containing protein [Mucilaginibacter aquariorum]